MMRFRLNALLLSGALLSAWPVAHAREGVEVGRASQFSKLVSAEQVEQGAVQQYAEMKQEASTQNALLPANHPQVIRLKAIAKRLIPFTYEWNARANQWQWEVIALKSDEVNAFCMPGGKIAFYTGILDQLKLSDDEVAMIMGHEMAHALREHARERMGKTAATNVGANLLSSLFGLGSTGDVVLGIGSQLVSMKFGREDESESDLIGMELAARAGYNPTAGVSLWQKMAAASKGAPPQFMSTHPSSNTRIKDIQNTLPQVMPLYARAPKPTQRFDVNGKLLRR